MKLDEIIKGIEIACISGKTDIEISGIAYDSRKVREGCLFVAMPGEKTDGHDFITDAVRKGASAIVYERTVMSHESGVVSNGPSPSVFARDVTLIRVKSSRDSIAHMAGNFYGVPSKRLSITGITGTNGKTTTSYLLRSVLRAWNKKTGLIGTIQYMIGDDTFPATHTTPEALEFQQLLNRMHESGCTHIVSEVSSHALAQKRVDGTTFRTVIFTNLTRDHLDYHETMEEYFNAKLRLFTELLAEDGTAVINLDDVYGKGLKFYLASQPTRKKVLTFSLEAGADLRATDISNSLDGLRFSIVMDRERYDIVSPLMGLPNVYNILSTFGAAFSLGAPVNVILNGLRNSGEVAGRFEKVDIGQAFIAVVDYAHTEDAIERLIYTAKGLTKGKIITVFGCGGDRDRGKRPVMGSIVTRLSDSVIVTSDNPRSEDPEVIINEIISGAVRKNYIIEPDRKEAIKRSVAMATEGDVVLVVGKGHETYQEIKGRRFEFDDREALKEAISMLLTQR